MEVAAPLIRGQDVPPRYRVDCVASRRVLPRERFRPLTHIGPRSVLRIRDASCWMGTELLFRSGDQTSRCNYEIPKNPALVAGFTLAHGITVGDYRMLISSGAAAVHV